MNSRPILSFDDPRVRPFLERGAIPLPDRHDRIVMLPSPLVLVVSEDAHGDDSVPDYWDPDTDEVPDIDVDKSDDDNPPSPPPNKPKKNDPQAVARPACKKEPAEARPACKRKPAASVLKKPAASVLKLKKPAASVLKKPAAIKKK